VDSRFFALAPGYRRLLLVLQPCRNVQVAAANQLYAAVAGSLVGCAVLALKYRITFDLSGCPPKQEVRLRSGRLLRL
jgi:hypothetical protein